ncbi:ABC drug exporter AtrF [Viridothelium virens]|uniref:ABC drug exporter AtrF n=1 Tax=Viridothelium virens TaxID=1048519 RepID=A0A6A6HND7_VIRVR|nr:ABC drug exporter AtrF [Viridothelium virens]
MRRRMAEEEIIRRLSQRLSGTSWPPDATFDPERDGRHTPESSSRRSQITEDELIRRLSKRLSGVSATSASTADSDHENDFVEINELLSHMFGRTRQEHSEEEKTRHVGVVFKNVTVQGMGLGAALQPTIGDIFLALPRRLRSRFASGKKSLPSKPPLRTIINNFSGCIKPGEMLLVLGRPGSGCSTFLKVLANQRFGYENIEGQLTYGGIDAHTMEKKYRGEVIYSPEDDFHYATLTVKNTLEFALKTRTPGKESREEGESRNDYVREFLRIVTKLFWIEHTLNTKVGNEYVRGVSGGEKKRVSIAEAMITKASTQAWDNSTKGLDASTALEYVQSIRALTNMAHISTAVSLYQAGESLYNLFDKVLLIDGGHCAYFGPTETAVEYFKDLGFIKPDRWTTADFLTSVADEHARHVREGWEHRIPRSAEDFGAVFNNSERARLNLAEIKAFEQETARQIEERQAAETKATKTKNYSLSFWGQIVACTKRQFLIMLGDKQALGGRWGGVLFQALIVGSLFYDLPKTAKGTFPRGGVLFFMLLFNALLALAELSTAFGGRPILLKHKSFSFYRPAAFAIAQTVVDIPLVFIQVAIFDVVVYFMANLQRTASQFFISLLFLWILTMTMYAFFRSIGALAGSLDKASRVTGISLQALIVYTGYLIPPRKMHPWFSWIRWIDPIQYGFEALMANEFYNLEIECEPPYLVPLVPHAHSQYQSCTIQGSTPGSTTVSGANYIKVAYSYSRSHLWRNFGFICAFFGFFVFLTAVGMELQKPNKGGGAVTVYKRGEVPDAIEKQMETGAEARDEEKGGVNVVAEDLQRSETPVNSELNTKNAEGVSRNDTIFTWQDVNYTVPVKDGERKLLQNLSGYVRPGKLTALMGSSGAGKTTLLNTLAQRINTGVVTGDFLVDGRPLPKSFQRSSGFAEQMDIHEPTSTVREALRFSARLRQPEEVPLQEKYDYCEKIIDLLEMRSIAGATIGKVGAGLNPEQRKRLTIAIELASKPQLLMFLDEPTSGLDSSAAFNIVRFLRKLADAGQAILCTIHQPSSVLFEYFDELVFLKRGGRLVYHGELGRGSRKLIDYFERNGAKKCPSKANPAEYMLEAIGAGNPDYRGPDWGDIWENSQERQARLQEIRSMIQQRRNASAVGQIKDDQEFAMPLSTQTWTVIQRTFISYWRTPDYIVGKFMLHITTALFNAFTFWNLGDSSIDRSSVLFSIFLSSLVCAPLIQQLQPKFLQLRNIYESRERNSKIYSWFAFATGAVLVELPYAVVAGTLYWCCWYWPTSFPRSTYTSARVWMFMMLFQIYYVGLGQAIASFAPSELLASLLVPSLLLFVVSFCGVVVPFPALPVFWRSWMYYLSPFTYLVEGYLALIVHDGPVRCDSTELATFSPPPGLSCEEYAGFYVQKAGGYVETLSNGMCGFCQYANGDEFAAGFNIKYSNVWRDYGVLWVYIIFNFFLVFFCSWLYLSGGRKIKQALNPTNRKERKEKKQTSQIELRPWQKV